MTSALSSSAAVGNSQSRATTNHQQTTSRVGGGKSPNGGTGASSSSSKSNGVEAVVRGSSVAFQPASRVEATSHRPHYPTPALSPKRVTSPRSEQHSSKLSASIFVSPGSFHSASSRVTDNPDPKKPFQGSTAASGTAPDANNQHGSTELVIADRAPSRLAAVHSSSSTSHLLDNYAVFEKETEVDQLSEPVVMGTHPDAGCGHESEKSPDSESATDSVRRSLSIKEDDLLDDFFKFVSDGKLFSSPSSLRVAPNGRSLILLARRAAFNADIRSVKRDVTHILEKHQTKNRKNVENRNGFKTWHFHDVNIQVASIILLHFLFTLCFY